MLPQRSEDGIDVVLGVVEVERDANVRVALGGDDVVLGKRGHQPWRVGRANTHERPFRRRCDVRPELLESGNEPRDEAGALDSYETAVALLTELGDSHGAGRVLANMGALESGQGHDEQARAYLHDALERLEPGSVEHDRTAQQLRRAG